MTTQARPLTDGRRPQRRARFHFDNRYLAPVLVTAGPRRGPGHLRLPRELVAHGAGHRHRDRWSSCVLGRLLLRAWPHLASAYVTGISVGILVRSPGVLAVRALLGHLDHVEVRDPRGRPAPLEPVEPRHRRDAGAGRRTRWPASACSGATTCCRWWSSGASARSSSTASAASTSRSPTWPRSSFLAAPRRGHRASLAGRGRAHHRADVPALHLLHDHGPEDDGAPEVGTVARRVPGRGGGGRPAAARVRRTRRTTRCSWWARPRTWWRSPWLAGAARRGGTSWSPPTLDPLCMANATTANQKAILKNQKAILGNPEAHLLCAIKGSSTRSWRTRRGLRRTRPGSSPTRRSTSCASRSCAVDP